MSPACAGAWASGNVPLPPFLPDTCMTPSVAFHALMARTQGDPLGWVTAWGEDLKSGSDSSFVMILDFPGPQGTHQQLFLGGRVPRWRAAGKGPQFRDYCAHQAPRKGSLIEEGGPSMAIPWRGAPGRRDWESGVPGPAVWEKEGQAVNGAEGGPARGLCTEGGAKTPSRDAGLGGGWAGGRGQAGPRGGSGGRWEPGVRLRQQQTTGSRGSLEPD